MLVSLPILLSRLGGEAFREEGIPRLIPALLASEVGEAEPEGWEGGEWVAEVEEHTVVMVEENRVSRHFSKKTF